MARSGRSTGNDATDCSSEKRIRIGPDRCQGRDRGVYDPQAPSSVLAIAELPTPGTLGILRRVAMRKARAAAQGTYPASHPSSPRTRRDADDGEPPARRDRSSDNDTRRCEPPRPLREAAGSPHARCHRARRDAREGGRHEAESIRGCSISIGDRLVSYPWPRIRGRIDQGRPGSVASMWSPA